MSGMPAFGKTHPDDKIWAIVAFTKKLTNMSKEQYQKFVEEAK
jgi:mono/diheme cytochrome c family protein